MSPRKSVIETAATRTRIIECALASASAEGLEGVTIGRLAGELAMSKAGVIGHFGTKEVLQLAVLDTAVDRFVRRVPARVVGARPGAERLARAFGEWFDYMADDHRGCFLTSVATEFDDRPGPVRDAVIAALSRWSAYVLDELGTAVDSGELPRDTDPDQLAFELNGVALATAQAVQLHHDPLAATRARRALARLLPP
ncbi:TetR/AcrR family transcriptional regulator [Streptosporangium roseum]|uniref:Transcriptional regulator, TetR family n=1 Tax=Streptosporangium roseum (strain ATCC 12428 / DSM 43021 / JCM 3005 / KCTC 9067 / NCIMB 10171 / NRRL 2505 / NI 9100) TaxID=479432 RepID=D2BAC9_STRRD|nr:TetR/AcrR family transcriptional regulator [Streptosporangium roseum]ACZ87954.1 putative transcriptional regulator, TetR family [Streptosporangium roseum DSM 43021]